MLSDPMFENELHTMANDLETIKEGIPLLVENPTKDQEKQIRFLCNQLLGDIIAVLRSSKVNSFVGIGQVYQLSHDSGE